MSDNAPFQIDIKGLRSKSKPADNRSVAAADAAGEEHGFLPREPGTRRGGRRPSPRTGQIHAKVLPNVAEGIAEEAQRRGVTQGVVIEEAWALYEQQARKADR
jgi:hypothetical protein